MKKGDLVSVHATGNEWWEHGLYIEFHGVDEDGDPYHVVLMADEVYHFHPSFWDVVKYEPQFSGRHEDYEIW